MRTDKNIREYVQNHGLIYSPCGDVVVGVTVVDITGLVVSSLFVVGSVGRGETV